MRRSTTSSTSNAISPQPKRITCCALRLWTRGGRRSQQSDYSLRRESSRLAAPQCDKVRGVAGFIRFGWISVIVRQRAYFAGESGRLRTAYDDKFFPPRAPDTADRRCKAFRSAPPRRVRPTLLSRPAQSGADRAGALDDASVMRLDRRIDQISAQVTQPRQRAILVRFREPAVADHVGGARPPVAQPDVMISSLASFETDHLKSLDCRGAKIASHSKKSR